MGCRTRKRKDELLRFVRNPKGNFMLEKKQEVGGRGAYLCPDPRCLKTAQKKNPTKRFEGVPVPSSGEGSLNG
jgi:predicted RNA-binding protein YlxR (DUF448 family)